MEAARGEVAAALGKRDAKTAAQVEKLMDEARAAQQHVVRLEVQTAREAKTEAKKIAHKQHSRAALLQRSSGGASYAVSMKRHSSQLRALVREHEHMASDSKRLLQKTKRAKAAAAAELKKAGAGSAKVEEVERLLGEAEGAARRVAVDDRKGVALTKSELRSVASLARELGVTH